MNIKEIYKDKIKPIKKGFDQWYTTISEAIEADDQYTLADDELTELIFDLIELHIKKQ